MIHERFGSAVEGVTLSCEQARFAAATARVRGVDDCVRFRVGDMLDVAGSSFAGVDGPRFQAVWACESSEHIDDLASMFAVFRRSLVEGGRIVVIAWCAGEGMDAERIKERVDEHYCTNVHRPAEYKRAASEAGLVACENVDLTALTIPYWRIRRESARPTGTEALMHSAFARRLMSYELFSFTTVSAA